MDCNTKEALLSAGHLSKSAFTLLGPQTVAPHRDRWGKAQHPERVRVQGKSQTTTFRSLQLFPKDKEKQQLILFYSQNKRRKMFLFFFTRFMQDCKRLFKFKIVIRVIFRVLFHFSLTRFNTLDWHHPNRLTTTADSVSKKGLNKIER